MADIGHFNAEAIDPNAGFEPFPPGKYKLVTTNSEWCPTKNNDGHYLKFERTIVDGEHRDRKIFNNFNLKNKNPKAVKIAEATLSALCRACGKKQIKDSAELHGIVFEAEIGVEVSEDGKYSNNVVKKYLFEDATVVKNGVAVQSSAPSAPAQSAPVSGAMPWQNG